MPVPDAKLEPGAFQSKTLPGLRVGYHRQPGGKWFGDYYIAEFVAFRINPGAKPSETKMHRTKEVVPPERLGPITFPLAEYRAKQSSEIVDDPAHNAFDPDGSIHQVLPQPRQGEPEGPEEATMLCEGPSADLKGSGGCNRTWTTSKTLHCFAPPPAHRSNCVVTVTYKEGSKTGHCRIP